MTQIPGQYPAVLWAIAVWREARGEGYKTQLGVAYAIRNRVTDKRGRWPKRFVDVILQPDQFSSFKAGDPNATLFPHPDDKSFDSCCQAVDDCAASIADPSCGATNFHSTPASQAAKWPKWADPSKLTAIIGEMKFYKL